MALKFLNKKGWHTGSLRNIENVWKAEQKRDAEDKKLEELRKQIQEERERSEFRQLQEQAGLVPKQERLDFLYDSGLAVGKGSSGSDGGFKALEAPKIETPSESSSKQQESVPGALFVDKPHSANDAWRKLHSDPLLMIRQREQEALAKIKNNPVKMETIRKSLDVKEKHKGYKSREKKKKKRSHPHDSESDMSESERRKSKHRSSKSPKKDKAYERDSESAASESERQKSKHHRSSRSADKEKAYGREAHGTLDHNTRKNNSTGKIREDDRREEGISSSSLEASRRPPRNEPPHKREKLSEAEKAARLREMQLDAERHENQRWKRLHKASEADAREEAASTSKGRGGRNFLEETQRRVYGATMEKGDGRASTTIEESVRSRAFYLQGSSEASERNAFRR
ncbi:pre-mRNA-splicing factor CWC25 homolog isoform X2 [Amborella trichopoda]|uniref:pre-mRNA-splicing factor CWC25 homolog isoform X2 n=1 Tax=Amborella trichopoda TaxID=13333 RepID=UPI0005D369F4|nr:pre-mRNA-splicing factor CWC25 homolog isoform X2 [Amborella trichopoda]|eukprot:XP_011628212.1 pre-mRNA-splicing factor CWC25 homolog isoform X2 [Amborella trichopoda]